MPPGFKHQRTARGVVAADNRGIMITVTSISSPSDDPTELAEIYAKSTGMTLESVSTGEVQGALRPLALFHGTAGGVAVRQIAVIYFGAGYKVAAVMQVPMSMVNDPSIQALGNEVGEQRIILP